MYAVSKNTPAVAYYAAGGGRCSQRHTSSSSGVFVPFHRPQRGTIVVRVIKFRETSELNQQRDHERQPTPTRPPVVLSTSLATRDISARNIHLFVHCQYCSCGRKQATPRRTSLLARESMRKYTVLNYIGDVFLRDVVFGFFLFLLVCNFSMITRLDFVPVPVFCSRSDARCRRHRRWLSFDNDVK